MIHWSCMDHKIGVDTTECEQEFQDAVKHRDIKMANTLSR